MPLAPGTTYSTAAPSRPRQGSGYINFEDFVRANRAGAQRLAGQLGAPVAEQGAEASRLLGRAQGDFDWQTKDAELRAGQTGVDYSGPNSLADHEDFSAGQEAAEKAQQGARRLADIYGRMGMLGETYGTTTGYGTGARAFDAALLGAVGQGGFEQQRQQYGGMGDTYRSALEASRGAADSARARGNFAALNKRGEQAFLENFGKPREAPPATQHPYVGGAQRVRDDNQRKAHWGVRG